MFEAFVLNYEVDGKIKITLIKSITKKPKTRLKADSCYLLTPTFFAQN